MIQMGFPGRTSSDIMVELDFGPPIGRHTVRTGTYRYVIVDQHRRRSVPVWPFHAKKGDYSPSATSAVQPNSNSDPSTYAPLLYMFGRPTGLLHARLRLTAG
jgi:hypothetical protein